MTISAHRRHDITDKVWKLLEPHLPGRHGGWGSVARDNRQFINAVFWILRTGSPWRDLPPDYGDWKNTHRRFCRWRDRGIWELLLEKTVDEPDYEWLMIDASHIKVHPHAAGARGGNQEMSRNKRGLNTKLHLAVDAHGMPIRVAITQGTTADCTQAGVLIEGLTAEYLFADRGYDSDVIVKQAEKQGMKAVIPPRKNRKFQRKYDKHLYKLRHLVENAFLHLKRWRGIATRYAKNSTSFLAAIHIRCLVLWCKIS
ncbi:MAG: IS5 family transposase [Simkaniaceae bacterium]|nr:MAG: IS5 family transposase [Simkaniaceae bacterium]QVL55065.1 MAG: IS5 family transposase [Simkaniaceae bacterium]QVL55128.1 MAG: IS5 family transposase [Simkaniaceae bacterium]QVL55209.1 MAG: IS5 family transposase [Simkaniaceae bacterium]QVL55870.1 MAG: IS5 family transposase [Simkaniaceae bacterium]